MQHHALGFLAGSWGGCRSRGLACWQPHVVLSLALVDLRYLISSVCPAPGTAG